MHPSPVHCPDDSASPAESAPGARRQPFVSYNPPPRDRSNKQRPLVVVVPPSILLHQHGLLGHTLSLGPSQRLAQGIVIPLYPTMYAQLTAIAKEFNFPSTAGLCLYLHHSDSAFTVTPRISDEAWHSLWFPAFDGHPPAARVAPIFGIIEFDVDLRYARWYSSWLSSSQKDIPDSASDCHRRLDSRTTIYDERADDRRDTYMCHPVSSLSSQRFPRKLSLLENTADTKILSPSTEKPFALAQALSPIAQESEPRAARQDFHTRVQFWRASAILDPSPIATTGQSSLEPANALKVQVSPEEYSWSITSAGPDDRESLISVDSGRLPSVYIEDRLAGSVCSAPSVCTSFGHGFDSPVGGIHNFPSPDLAQGAVTSVSMIPMTATTWSSPSDPAHPRSVSCPLSVDVGHRHTADVGHRHTATAASRGAPLSYPRSPLVPSVPISPDIGCRVLENMLAWPDSWAYCCYSQKPQASKPLRPENGDCRYPHFNIYPAIYPFFDLYPAAAGKNTSTLPLTKSQSSASHATSMIQISHYPYLHIYPAIYPFFDLYPPVAGESSFTVSLYMDQSTIDHAISVIYSFDYPHLRLYPAVYPFFDIYPAVAAESSFTSSCMGQCAIDHATSTTQGFHYPYLRIYPAVYPFLDLYPALAGQGSSTFSLWMDQSAIEHATSKIQSSQYPYLCIYPVVYPFLDLYPAIAGESSPSFSSCMNLSTVNSTISLIHSWHYSYLSIYRPVYPFFDLYPAMTAESPTAPTSSTDQNSGNHAISDTQGCQYPYLSIYPAIYPFFNLYPSKAGESSFDQTSVDHATQNYLYPYLNIYPAVYPFFNIYPSLAGMCLSTFNPGIDTASTDRAISITLQEYPSFNLYPSCYPFLDIYPNTLQIVQLSPCFGPKGISISLDTTSYPNSNLYPAAYPFLDIYPSIIDSDHYSQPPALVKLPVLSTYSCSYPIFDLYPAVYPYFDIYPAISQSNPSRMDDVSQSNDPPVYKYPALVISEVLRTAAPEKPVITCLKPTYPFIDIYPPVYPHLKLYPVVDLPNFYPVAVAQCLPLESYLDINTSIDAQSPARIRSRYTHAELHEQVLKERWSKKLGRKKSHQDLHFSVFPNGFVSTPSGTTQPLVESYIVHDTNGLTPLFKAALQVQVTNLSS